jgi:two-component system, NtrC family, response regulator
LLLKFNKMIKQKILIIDDEENLRNLLSRLMELEGFVVLQAPTSARGMELFKAHPEIQVVVTDVRLPDDNGIQILKKVKGSRPEVEVVVITAFGNIHDGVECMKQGAFDYLTKDDQNDQMVVTIQRAAEKAGMATRIDELEKKLSYKYNFDNITGYSKRIKEAVSLAKKVALTDTSVLLEGETGTGKELFAQSIHYGSSRKKKAFVPLNCSAVPKDLLESELFGFNRGAFTGALNSKMGLIETAQGGTLFLDEIGEMDMGLQSKLLRVIETHTFLRLGDPNEARINFRLIAATNKNLRQEVERGNFREDLFHRLSVFNINIPALRERLDDIEPLANQFLTQFAQSFRKSALIFDPGVIQLFKKYNWKGNVRELRNTIERAVIIAEGNRITEDLLPLEIRSQLKGTGSFSLAENERVLILQALHTTNNNKTEAAKLLNISLATLYRKLEDYKLNS